MRKHYFTHGEQGILKTAQCAVLPCEVSEGIRLPDAVTEAAAFLTAAEDTTVYFTFKVKWYMTPNAQFTLTQLTNYIPYAKIELCI